MNEIKNTALTGISKTLRKNMTREEKHLWYDFFKALPLTVHRQKVIGNYIVDFYIAEAHIAIELDGSQHYEDKGREADQVRDRYLNEMGITVLRYSNYDVQKSFAYVCSDLLKHLEDRGLL